MDENMLREMENDRKIEELLTRLAGAQTMDVLLEIIRGAAQWALEQHRLDIERRRKMRGM